MCCIAITRCGIDQDALIQTGESREAIDRFAYLPFGAGPRVCIGATFAIQEATIVIATIMRHFTLQLSPGHVAWPVQKVTLRPKGGLPMTVRRRQ